MLAHILENEEMISWAETKSFEITSDDLEFLIKFGCYELLLKFVKRGYVAEGKSVESVKGR